MTVGRRVSRSATEATQRQREAAPAKVAPTPAGRLTQNLEARPLAVEQLERLRIEAQRQQVQLQLEQQAQAVQAAHLDRLQAARTAQGSWQTATAKPRSLRRALTEHLVTAQAARQARASFVAQRQSQRLEALLTGRLEEAVRPALPEVKHPSELTLGHVADHMGQKASAQIYGDPRALHNYTGFKNAGATLVKHFRAPGSSHSVQDLAGAIGRFRDPGQRGAVESAALAALGHHPSFPAQLQRALDDQDARLEAQREVWQRELAGEAEGAALEEASGEGAAERIGAARGGGEPLPEGVRKLLEARWNTDLSRVRVHLGTEADALSKTLNAKAFTSGQDVFFRAGTWNPASLEGLQLIAHETWHTVQQAQGLVQAGVDRNAALETEARGKGSELSNEDLENILKVQTQKTKRLAHALTKPGAAAATLTRALQRDPSGSTRKASGGNSVWVPITSSIDTPRELMIELLVKLGYERSLAEQHTDAKGVFTYGDDTRRWQTWRKPTAQEIKAGRIAVSVSAEEQAQTKQTASGANTQFRAIRSTTRGIRRQGAAPTDVKTVAEIGKIGIVFNPDGVNLYAKPNTGGKDTPLQRVAFNTKVMVVRELEGGWYQVSLPGGNTGYVNKSFLRVYPDDPGANLHQVTAGQSALGVAERYYRPYLKPGMDLRYFVNVLAHVNPNALKTPDSGNWKEVAFNASTVIRVPGLQFALSLRAQVDNGSLTDGMYSSLTGSLGRLGDITKSVLESPQFIGEVLGELWEVIKPKWVEFAAITAALIAAEMAVSALAAAPEPTMITKVVAMLLQGAILLFAGYGAAVSLYSALTEGATWIKTAWNANGKYAQIHQASKAFLRMVGSIALAVLAIMGVRGSLGRFRTLYTKYKTKLPVVEEAPIPPKSTPSSQPEPQPSGLETRGYKPKPGERNQTREQYNAEQQQARVQGYNAKNRTDAQLAKDVDPAPRPSETTQQAQTRVQAAQEELAVRKALSIYEALGPKPIKINIRANDARFPDAHTLERHGPSVPLRRTDVPPGSGLRTIEGRIYGDPPWPNPEKNSSRWLSEGEINETINNYILSNWEKIRSELALNPRGFEALGNAGKAIGEGFMNTGTHTNPVVNYVKTSQFMIRIKLVPGNPPTVEVRTAFPNARGY